MRNLESSLVTKSINVLTKFTLEVPRMQTYATCISSLKNACNIFHLLIFIINDIIIYYIITYKLYRLYIYLIYICIILYISFFFNVVFDTSA